MQQDANYNVTAVISTAGVVQERYVYDPYGAVTVLDGSWGSRASSTVSWVYGWQGLRHDTTTLYVYARYRDVTVTLMRPLSEDPLGFAAGCTNFYVWIGNNPGNGVDPFGLEPPAKSLAQRLLEPPPPPAFSLNLPPPPAHPLAHRLGQSTLRDPNQRQLSGDLTEEERDALLTIPEIILDILGIFDPTPTCDGLCAGIAIKKGDHVGAGCNVAGAALPVLGDTAKVSKWGNRIRRFFNQLPVSSNKVATPTLNKGGKIADKVPNAVPDNWTRLDVEDAIHDYRRRIQARGAEQADFDAMGRGTPWQRKDHLRRIVEEENFLRQLERKLGQMDGLR